MQKEEDTTQQKVGSQNEPPDRPKHDSDHNWADSRGPKSQFGLTLPAIGTLSLSLKHHDGKDHYCSQSKCLIQERSAVALRIRNLGSKRCRRLMRIARHDLETGTNQAAIKQAARNRGVVA